MLASAAPPTEQGSICCSSSEQDFLWNIPSPLQWTFLGQGLSTGCCHLYPPHPTPKWKEGPQGSNVKPAGIFLLMFASNVYYYKKPSKECIGVRLLFCREMATKSGPSSSSNLHHPPHWHRCFFFPHHFPHPTPVPGSKSQQLPLSSPPLAQLIFSHLPPAHQLHSFTVRVSMIPSVVPASLLSQPPSSPPLLRGISVSVTQTTPFSLRQLWSPLHLALAASSTIVLGIRRNSRYGIIVLCFDAWLWLSSQALWSSLAIVCIVPLQHGCSLTSMSWCGIHYYGYLRQNFWRFSYQNPGSLQ